MALPVVMPGLAAVKYYVGQTLGCTEWLEITQERIDRFGRATGDDNWIHCDADRASLESPWKAPIAQGYLMLSLVPDLLEQLLVLIGWARAINTAAEKCSFPAPARVGSRIRMHGSLVRSRSVPGGGLRLSFGVEFEVEGQADPACKAIVHYVYFP